MTHPPFDNPLQLTRQQIHDIRDMAQAGYGWDAIEGYLKLPLPDIKSFVRQSMPNCVPFFESGADTKNSCGN